MITIKQYKGLFGSTIQVHDELSLIGTITTLTSGYSASSIAQFHHKHCKTQSEAVSWIVATVQAYQAKSDVA